MAKSSEKSDILKPLIPPEGDKEVGPTIYAILDEILKDKDQLGKPKRWMRNAELVRNKFWKLSSLSVPQVSANLIHTHLVRIVNQLTDNSPTFNVVPAGDMGDSVEEALRVLHDVIDNWWRESEQQDVFAGSVKNGETYGTAIEKLYFNPDAENGIGDVQVDIVDPFHFGFYPVDSNDIQKCDAVLHFRPMPIRDVRRIWKDKADQIVADDELIKSLGDDRRNIVTGKPGEDRGYFASIGASIKNLLGMDKTAAVEGESTLVVEAWVRDYTRNNSEHNETVTDPETGEEMEVIVRSSEPKYTGEIRRIICCSMGNVVLEDKDNPSINPNLDDDAKRLSYLYNRFPFPTAQSQRNTMSIWGDSDIEQLEPLQAEINKTLSQITHFKDKSARQKQINPLTSGVSNSAFTNTAGIINPVNSMEAQGIRWTGGPEMQTDLVQYLEIYKALFFMVSGAFDMDQAQFQGQDVVAYKAIAALLERSAAMQRSKERQYTRMIRERGRMYLSLASNWYTEDRYISMEDQGRQQPIPINADMLRKPARLMVVSGSTMPVSLVQRREEATQLYKEGLIDQTEALKRLDWPDYIQVVERMKAGPYAELLKRLEMTGMPKPLLQFVDALTKIDAKKFEQAVKSGEVPMFMDVMKQALTGQPPEDPQANAENMKAQAEASLKMAQAKKEEADILRINQEALKLHVESLLAAEKISTEKFNREVQAQGVQMDWETIRQNNKKLEHEAAQIVAGIEAKKQDDDTKRYSADLKHDDAKTAAQQGPYREKGLKSNNKEAGK